MGVIIGELNKLERDRFHLVLASEIAAGLADLLERRGKNRNEKRDDADSDE
jgi:hypothetical protein